MPLAGYSGTPLVKKLGINPGSTVALVGAPVGFRRELVGLPEGVRVTARAAGSPDLVIWFVAAERDLKRRMSRLGRLMGSGLWIAWPKRASGVPTDVTEDLVRTAGLAQGLVDYKVCAINQIWSGLKFARRRADRRAAARRRTSDRRHR
jgi:hypothetical protein